MSHRIDNGDGTVTDTQTGLMWSQATITPKPVTHAKAEKACAALHLAGHADWRMPTIRELLSLVDFDRCAPAIDTTAFPDTKHDWYWTSTIAASSSVYAWFVDFDLGLAVSSHRVDYDAFVRAVRTIKEGV